MFSVPFFKAIIFQIEKNFIIFQIEKKQEDKSDGVYFIY